ncbi:MAG TPA: 16S rRNA (adenine(1518)-N(6)/adenine(1519)-N(6))-dimethyltransferase RsmA [Candidatus Bathyarchaeia archaeon]|nr:16S rRNA (adenine(1518)-N(6)/adenine(1519)-N(6))-dimethyltransferase RsmA [Candidatus Bathyarchaeia archaeon]
MSWVRRELNALSIPPLKRFGQHFLIDKKTRQIMIESARLEADDTVVEVGPGLGFITTTLTSQPCSIIAIEKDRTLADYLKNRFARNSNITIVQGDALEFPIRDQAKIISSPPYNISSKLILSILNSKFKLAVLLLQDEFVSRLTAPVGSRDYGRLTVALQLRANVERIMGVPRSAFYPSPKVDSAIVRIEPKASDLRIKDQKIFNELVRSLFTQRRRKLRGVLKRYLKETYPTDMNEILIRTSFLEKRIFEIAPLELVVLSNIISEVRVDVCQKRLE